MKLTNMLIWSTTKDSNECNQTYQFINLNLSSYQMIYLLLYKTYFYIYIYIIIYIFFPPPPSQTLEFVIFYFKKKKYFDFISLRLSQICYIILF